MTVRTAAREEAGAISEVVIRAKAHRGYELDFLDASRPELTWRAEEHGRGIGGALAEALLTRAAEAGSHSLTIAADPDADGFSAADGATGMAEVPSDIRSGRVLPLLRFDLEGGAR